jgi:hypothetical protein
MSTDTNKSNNRSCAFIQNGQGFGAPDNVPTGPDDR